MGAGRFVGRVGGLAVALGVGAAVSLGHGIAWADEGPGGGSEHGGSSAADGTSSGVPDQGTSAGAADNEPDVGPEPRAKTGDSPAPPTTTGPATAPVPGSSHKRKPASTKAAAKRDTAGAPKSSVTSRTVRHVDDGEAASAPRVVKSAPVAAASVTTASVTTATAPVAEVAPAAPVVTQATAAVAGAVAESSLLGGAPGGPLVNSPLLWVAAAASRREFDGATSLATAAVNNRPPTLGNPSVGKPNAVTGVVTGKIAGKDADKDVLTYSAPAVSTKGGTVVVTASTGAFTYTPSTAARHNASLVGAAAAAKTDTFTITVSDGFGGSASKVVTVAVSPKNAAPTVATTPTVNTPDTNGLVTGTLGALDADADVLTFKATPKKGAVVFTAGGGFTFTPTAAARHAAAVPGAKTSVTTETFTVTITDAHGGTITKAVTVGIKPADVAPVIATVTAGTPNTKSGVVSGKITATDADKDTLTYSGTSTVKGKVAVNAKTGTFTYTPTAAARHAASAAGAADAMKSDTVTVTVSDGHGGTATTTVQVTVLGANTAPTVAVTVGKPNTSTGVVTGAVTGKDADKDALTYTTPAASPKGTVTINASTGAFTYTPSAAARHAASVTGAPTAAKTDTFTVTVTDAHGGITTKAVNVAVAPANTAPTVATTPTVNAPNSSGVVTGSLNAADADDDVLMFKATPKKGAITFAAGGSFTYTPTAKALADAAKPNAPATAKSDTFTVTVTDNHGGTATKTLTLTIGLAVPNAAPINGGCTITNTNTNTGAVTGTVTATDPDGDNLTYSGPASTSKGSITMAGNTFTYTPTSAARQAAGAPGAPTTATQDTFTVTANDGKGANLAIAVTVTIAPPESTGTGSLTDGGHSSILNALGDNIIKVSDDGSRAVVVTFASGVSNFSIIDAVTGAKIGATLTVAGTGYWSDSDVYLTNDASRAVLVNRTDNKTARIAILDTSSGTQIGTTSTYGGQSNEFLTVQFNGESGRLLVHQYVHGEKLTLIDVETATELTTFTNHGDGTPLWSLEPKFSPDGSRLIVADNQDHEISTPTGLIQFHQSVVSVINAVTGTLISESVFGDSAGPTIDFSSDSTRAIIPMAHYTGTARFGTDRDGTNFVVVDTVTGAVVGSNHLPGSSQIVLATVGTKAIVSTYASGLSSIAILNLSTGTKVGSTSTMSGVVSTDVVLSATGNRALLTVPYSYTYTILDVASAQQLGTFTAHSDVLISPDGSRIVATSYNLSDGTGPYVRVLNGANGAQIGDTVLSTGYPPVALNSAGTRAIIPTSTGVAIIDTANGTRVGNLITDKGSLLAISPNGNRALFSASTSTPTGYTSTLTVINTTTGAVVGTPVTIPGIIQLEISDLSDSRAILVSSQGGHKITAVDLNTGQRIGATLPVAGVVQKTTLAPNSNRAITFTSGSTMVVTVYNIAT